jgi:hemoglobin
MSNFTDSDKPKFGLADASYQAAGQEAGIRKLCIEFYKQMDSLPEAQKIRDMHSESLDLMIDKLTLFLCLWLGGPKDYIDKYGSPNMLEAHKHLTIN